LQLLSIFIKLAEMSLLYTNREHRRHRLRKFSFLMEVKLIIKQAQY
jgi:hypothetical protein